MSLINWIKSKTKRENKQEVSLPKHYHYDSSHEKYVVTKSIKGQLHYYGRYKDEETAQYVVAQLKKVNWDKDVVPLLQEYLKIFGV